MKTSLRLAAMLCLVLPLTAQSRLVKVSGDGQLAQLYNAFTLPLVVRAVDGAGQPVAGKAVTWSDVGGISYASSRTVVTDASGYASLTWVPGGEISIGVAYRQYTVTAASDVGNVSFNVVAYPYVSGAFNPQPTIQLLKPGQLEITRMQSGGRLANGVQIVVVTSGGNGVSPGLPIPGVGLTVKTANQDAAAGPVASCTAGTILTGADGTASCELLALGKPGSTEMIIDVGNQVTFRAALQVAAGDPTPVVVQGNYQSGAPGTTLPVRLTARLQDAAGSPLPGATAIWTVIPAGSVSLLSSVGTADASGLVSTGVQLGAAPGTFEVRVTSGSNYASFAVSATGTVSGLTVTSSTLPPGSVGVSYSQSLGATGGTPPYTWSYASGTLPPGLTVAGNGIVSGVPTAGGTYSFTVRATDSRGVAALGGVTLSVGTGLAVATTLLPNGAAGVLYRQTLTAAGGVPPYTWALASSGIVASQLPAGLSLSPAGVISGTPLAAGSSTFTVKLTDAAGREAYQYFTLVIGLAPANPLTITSTGLPRGTAGTAYSQAFAAAGGTAPYTWSVASGTLPLGLTLSPAGVLAGTPAAAGAYTFTARVADSLGAAATAVFTVEVGASGVLSRAGVLAQIATGGGWKTTMNLVNVQSSSTQVRVQFMAQDGSAMDLPYVVTQGGQSVTSVGSTVDRLLPANSSLLIETEAAVSTTRVGWAEVRSAAPVSGYAIFRQKGTDGRESEGTSPLETRAQAAVLVPFDNLIGYSTGVAMVNLAAAAANVTAIWRDESGTEIGRSTFSLAAGGHDAFSLPDRFPALSGRRGVVEFQSNQPAGLAALGLRFNPTLNFTSVPVVVR
ncbi:MAG: putative Ig domain-containing protein [Acidobacteria bacterium]|nr:putative Ig domain-containing protein [Acidobacteriota bacterium]